MPGFDASHLVVLFAVAFLVLGPQRMGEIARRIGQFAVESQRQSAGFARALQEGVQGESSAPAATPAPKAVPSNALSIPDHLRDLRKRLIISIGAVLILTTIAYVFSDTILYILRAPAGDIKLRAFSPMDGFLVHFRVALYGGIFLTAPIWIFELMGFIAPALKPNEKRWIIPGVAAMVVLFLLGNGFGYLMLKNMVSVLFTMFGSELEYLPSADQYISFVVYFLLATGIAFELPVALLVLMKIGVLSPDTLRKQRRIVYFILFVFAELITPVADPIVAPTVVMIPMVVLFELALLVARFTTPKKPALAAPPAQQKTG